MATSNPALNPKLKIISIYNKERTDRGLSVVDINDYDFSNPTPYAGVKSTKNTILYLIPKSTSAQFGKITIYYDRIDLATILNTKVIKGTATTVTQLLPEINEELGVELANFDVEEAILGTSPTFTLTASPLSFIFIGSTTVGYYT